MKVLLDTHTLIWFVLNDKHLSASAEAVVREGGNDVFVSPATYWELAIKVSIGKYHLSIPYDEFIRRALKGNNIAPLPIEPRHTGRVIDLPHHHRDPFDRLLVAQALVESIPIVSSDAVLDAYGVTRIW